MSRHSEFIHIVNENGRAGKFLFKNPGSFAYALACEDLFQMEEAGCLQHSENEHKLWTRVALVYIPSLPITCFVILGKYQFPYL